MGDEVRHARKQLDEFLKTIQQLGARIITERRAERRFVFPTGVYVQSLDPSRQPTGKTRVAVLRDISLHGIGILSINRMPLGPTQVRMKLPDGQQIRLIVELLRCEPIDPEMYDVGGRVIWPEVGDNGSR